MLFTYHICIYHRHMSYMEIYKNLRKSCKFHGSAVIGGVYGEPFFVIFLCGTCCGGFWGALWRLWGPITLLGATLGSHWASKRCPMAIFESIPHSEVGGSSSAWRPRGRVGKGYVAVGTAHIPLLGRLLKTKKKL